MTDYDFTYYYATEQDGDRMSRVSFSASIASLPQWSTPASPNTTKGDQAPTSRDQASRGTDRNSRCMDVIQRIRALSTLGKKTAKVLLLKLTYKKKSSRPSEDWIRTINPSFEFTWIDKLPMLSSCQLQLSLQAHVVTKLCQYVFCTRPGSTLGATFSGQQISPHKIWTSGLLILRVLYQFADFFILGLNNNTTIKSIAERPEAAEVYTGAGSSTRVCPLGACGIYTLIGWCHTGWHTKNHGGYHIKDRVNVMTPINGYEWPVPMPKDANLDLIRIEM
ncbi:hypothetical protein ARMSODRAFT_1024918 [Armillaria solidipes]|uniref:Uncharacterized protein n=1 Tax=Armillaria solidipes TaxID=1076256 RepID=A0A2H3BCK2_9AGAR|nr:hypothetical protein ARMSODRAFT_1024918 [Armillaria solidipes]